MSALRYAAETGSRIGWNAAKCTAAGNGLYRTSTVPAAADACTGQGMQYQQIPPVYHPQMQSTSEPPVGVGEWIGSMILRAIPVVGLIMMLVWSFSHSTNPSKRNWARAQLIIAIVSTLIGIVIGVIFVLADSFSGGYYY